MKRILLLIAVVLGFAATTVNAQDQPVRFGIRAGLNVADWQGETVNSAKDLIDRTGGSVSQEVREGFHVGGYISIPVTRGFEIEPGLQYSQKGTRLIAKIPMESVSFLNAKATFTNKAEYIDLPVLAKVYVGEGFHIYAGPQVSYLVSNKVRARAGALGINALNQEWEMENGIRKFDFAVSGGLGYRFANGFNITAGYDHGLSTIDENRSFDTYNRVVKASIGYTF